MPKSAVSALSTCTYTSCSWAPALLSELFLATRAAFKRVARAQAFLRACQRSMAERSKRAAETKDTPVPLPRNEKGGILITEDELKVAWEFFDTSGKGKLTMSEIKRRLQTFYKDITTREVKFLLNNQPEITFDELYALLKDNQLTNFDPVKEAFKVLVITFLSS
ncbi:hypothetical protein AK812_SmicGene10168 [Symbiodinium microadriaticum]|uniref:EF-hand domain-containing protein n=1 Tax=Symbiodinium microadriaticum TaxID=2951 RepID=A0A1Q9EGJ5_SYMMI|nr:hypothetical protein AK812_SmicGene10168 [Symbiodinium microadriaticum]